MIEEAEALARILDAVPGPRRESVALGAALGRRLLEPVLAAHALPSFDNSAMDGYAVRAVDAGQGAVLEVVGEQPAGPDRGLRLGPGTAVRIFTGAPIPAGADAVVAQEDVTRCEGGSAGRIIVREAVDVGEFVRRRGADVCAGQLLAGAGDLVTPGMIALLASQGIGEVSCGETPGVAILTTGDELVEPGTGAGAPPPGCLFNSNAPMLEALARASGVQRVVRRHVPDDPCRTEEALRELSASAGFVLVAGGVSVGEHDHVKGAMDRAGFESAFWRVRLKPGKPMVFASHRERPECLLFGLPGNPVSAFVTFLAFVMPALLAAAGARIDAGIPCPGLRRIRCRTSEAIANPGDRPHYVRGRLGTDAATFVPTGLQQSHAVYGLSRAEALVRVSGDGLVPAGGEVDALLLP